MNHHLQLMDNNKFKDVLFITVFIIFTIPVTVATFPQSGK